MSSGKHTVFHFHSRKITVLIVLLAIIILSLMSCVSFDSQQEGIVGSVYDVNGVKVLVDPASDRLLAFALRNDSNRQVTVNIRPIGGEIGYDTSGGSGFGGKASGNRHRAAYITSPNNIILNPGNEVMGQVFLKNWYLANKNFTSRIEFKVGVPEEIHMIMIEADQDDMFDDSKDMFQQNKLGKNDPTRYASRHIGVDRLPDTYSLAIPD